jgi:hypothetical protein
MRVRGDSHTFNVRGVHPGRSIIEASNRTPGFHFGGFIPLVVQGPPTEFHFFKPHNHMPSGRWSKVQADPNNAPTMTGTRLAQMCQGKTPKQFVDAVIASEFGDKPIALAHLKWYLSNGQGRDFVEDDNIRACLERDAGVRHVLAAEIRNRIETRHHSSGRWAHHIELSQSSYSIQDFQYSFGAIDRLDFEVDFDDGTVHVWFQDRYEWHPVYKALY